MSIWVAIGLALLSGGAPYVLGRPLAQHGSPRALVAVSLGSVLSIGLAFGLVLAAIMEPASLPSGTFQSVVERCLGAASDVLLHPLPHWPRITALLMLLALTGRVTWAALVTQRSARRERAVIASLPTEWVAPDDSLRVVRSDHPFAFAVSALGRRTVYVSRGLVDALTPRSLDAVLAHERAHISGRHGLPQLIGRVMSHAFRFVPPIRLASDQLILGLEMVADDRAADLLGDPLLLASAVVDVAERSHLPPGSALGVGSQGVAERVARLTSGGSSTKRRAVSVVSLVLSLAIFACLMVAVPASARNLGGTLRIEAEHAQCHLPAN